MRMPAGALAGLRELAAAAAARSPPPLPPGAPRRTRCCTRPAAVAGAAPALRAPMAAMHSSGGEGDSTVSNGDAAASAARRDLPLPRDSQAALQHSISQLLDAGRPIVAAHLLAEEWAATSRCLDDEELRWAAARWAAAGCGTGNNREARVLFRDVRCHPGSRGSCVQVEVEVQVQVEVAAAAHTLPASYPNIAAACGQHPTRSRAAGTSCPSLSAASGWCWR